MTRHDSPKSDSLIAKASNYYVASILLRLTTLVAGFLVFFFFQPIASAFYPIVMLLQVENGFYFSLMVYFYLFLFIVFVLTFPLNAHIRRSTGYGLRRNPFFVAIWLVLFSVIIGICSLLLSHKVPGADMSFVRLAYAVFFVGLVGVAMSSLIQLGQAALRNLYETKKASNNIPLGSTLIAIPILSILVMTISVIIPIVQGTGVEKYSGTERRAAEETIKYLQHATDGISSISFITYSIDDVRPIENVSQCQTKNWSEYSEDPNSIRHYAVEVSETGLFGFTVNKYNMYGCRHLYGD